MPKTQPKQQAVTARLCHKIDIKPSGSMRKKRGKESLFAAVDLGMPFLVPSGKGCGDNCVTTPDRWCR
jgi:hypothetical protein